MISTCEYTYKYFHICLSYKANLNYSNSTNQKMQRRSGAQTVIILQMKKQDHTACCHTHLRNRTDLEATLSAIPEPEVLAIEA